MISIVPSLPPSINGVGDYAFLLARELRCHHGLDTQFLVNDTRWTSSSAIEGFQSDSCSNNPEQFASQLSNGSTVLLHYVNYAYQKRGCPLWLFQGLRLWKAQSPHNRLVTMFHELYAFGPPWTSSFWLSPVHRVLAAQLCKLSNFAVTSMSMYSAKLSAWDESKAGLIHVLPVFSNIGEPVTVPKLKTRKNRMVIFGGKAMRTRAYTVSLKELTDVCQKLCVDEIVDVGPELGFSIPNIGVPQIVLGKLDQGEIYNIMVESKFGYIDYFPGYLVKSGIFATYCSHGLVPVCARYNPSEKDNVYNGKHYLESNAKSANLTSDFLQSISNNAFAWYQNHRLAKQTEMFAAVLMGD